MFVSLKTVSPERGSTVRVFTVSCSSGENQRSETTSMARSLPIWPAGMVRIVRLPSTCRPSIICLPSDSFLADAIASTSAVSFFFIASI